MACNEADVITSAELSDLKKDIQTIDDVVELTADTTTTKTGATINTLRGQLKLLGYEVPVTYAGGIVFGVDDNTKTVDESGVVYAPYPSALPFTTSGTFIGDDDARFFVVQGLTTFSSEVVLSADTVADLKAKNLQSGQTISTKGYYTEGDGGGALYLIQTAGEFGGTPDEFSNITLNNGNIAVIQRKNGIWDAQQSGCVADLVTDDTEAFTAFANAIKEAGGNLKAVFPGKGYLLSYSGGLNNVFGEDLFPIVGIKNLELDGQGTVIKVVDHDVAVNGGLRIFVIDGSQNIDIHHFEFDMTFVGQNQNGSFYPQCGAIVLTDTAGTAGSRTGDQLSSGIKEHDNIYNLRHPLGAYAKSSSPYLGDYNNGFKIYSCTLFGDRLAQNPENQNFDFTSKDSRFLPTHTAYGIWTWAFSNVSVTGHKASSWANFASDASGVPTGSSIPMVRYHQFYNTGVIIEHNEMLSRPLVDRVGTLQGVAQFCHVTTNLDDALEHGETLVSNNTCRLSDQDTGVAIGVYGVISVHDNIFKADDVSSRPKAAIDVLTNENGKTFLSIKGNTTDRTFSGPILRVDNSADLAANRRVKVISIKNNESLNSFGAGVVFVNNSSKTTTGCELVYCENNTFDGVNSEFNPANGNGAAFSAAISTEATDTYYLRNNIVRHYYNIDLSGAATVKSIHNDGNDVTASGSFNYLAENLQTVGIDSFDNPEVPRVGSFNGGSGNDLYRFFARRVVIATGITQQQTYGVLPGGTSIAGTTPAGERWYIDNVLIATKRGLT